MKKLTLKTSLLFSIVCSLASATAFADKMGPRGDKFYEEAAHFENACAQKSVCRAPYSNSNLYDQKARFDQIAPSVKDSLKAVAEDQSQVWGDTILEGDYIVSGRTRLDSVVAYFKDNRLVGYKIRYSQKAWYVGECNYDGTRESLKNCKEGRIVEGSYVSGDVQTYFTDEEKHADFSFLAE